MKIELVSCPRCGESDLVFQDGFYRCRFCGAMLKEEQKIDIEERIAKAMEAGRESDLGKLRFLLNQTLAVQYPDPAEIRDRCDDILRIIPEDISASFFRAFFKRKKNRAEYQVWFKSFHEKLSPFHKKLLYPYIIDLCDYVDADCVKTFLKQQGDSSLIKKVDAALKEREAEIERFSNVPRDVFVCHAHADIKKILPLVERIEKEEGFSFWLSERNMPIDVENYKLNIKNAIKNCRIFLVFASQASMQSSDVHWELDIAEELGKDKRIEYRLEDRPNNIKFKHFFDGIQWIDGAKRSQSDELAERIYLLKKKQAPKAEEPKALVKEEKKEETPKKDPNQAKLKAINLKIKFGKFEEAVSDIFAFLGEDEENLEAWKLGIEAASRNRKQNNEEALQFYHGLIERDPKNEKHYEEEYAALFALESEEEKKAKKEAEKAAKKQENLKEKVEKKQAKAQKREESDEDERERIARMMAEIEEEKKQAKLREEQEKKEAEERAKKEAEEAKLRAIREKKEREEKQLAEREEAIRVSLFAALKNANEWNLIEFGTVPDKQKVQKTEAEKILRLGIKTERSTLLYEGKEYYEIPEKGDSSWEGRSFGVYPAVPFTWHVIKENDQITLFATDALFLVSDFKNNGTDFKALLEKKLYRQKMFCKKEQGIILSFDVPKGFKEIGKWRGSIFPYRDNHDFCGACKCWVTTAIHQTHKTSLGWEVVDNVEGYDQKGDRVYANWGAIRPTIVLRKDFFSILETPEEKKLRLAKEKEEARLREIEEEKRKKEAEEKAKAEQEKKAKEAKERKKAEEEYAAFHAKNIQAIREQAKLTIKKNRITFGLFPTSSASAFAEKLEAIPCQDQKEVIFEGKLYGKFGGVWFLYEPIEWQAMGISEAGNLELVSKNVVDAAPITNNRTFHDSEEASIVSYIRDVFLPMAYPFEGVKPTREGFGISWKSGTSNRRLPFTDYAKSKTRSDSYWFTEKKMPLLRVKDVEYVNFYSRSSEIFQCYTMDYPCGFRPYIRIALTEEQKKLLPEEKKPSPQSNPQEAPKAAPIPNRIDKEATLVIARVEIREREYSGWRKKYVVLKKPNVKIGAYAFMNCRELESFEGERVTEIEPQTFFGCEKLSKIVLHGVERIATEAFAGCKSLAVLPWGFSEGTVTIGKRAFAGSGLRTINLPLIDGINDYAFESCTSLEKVIIGPEIAFVGKGAFKNCTCQILLQCKKPFLKKFPNGFDKDWLEGFKGEYSYQK